MTLLNPTYITRIDGVPQEDMATIRRLLKVWRDKYPKNLLRTAFYDAKQRFVDLGVSIPPGMADKIGNVVSWPQKSVRALADKSIFEGFEQAGADHMGIQTLTEANDLPQAMSEAVISAYKHSCSFITIDYDPSDPSGEGIILMPRSADWSAAIWDTMHRRVAAALTITGNDRHGDITDFNVWLPGRNYACHRTAGQWQAARQGNRLDRVAVIPIVYDRQMDRPFGRSRINTALMRLTDMAVRTTVRMEATAEFYAVPKLWFLGLTPDALKGHEWSSLVSAINAISRDEDSHVPDLKQVQQASMSPHGTMLETIAMLASSETDIPPENLGIRVTNPTSAEALAAAENQLTRVADRQNLMFSSQLKNMLSMAIQLRDNSRTPPDLSGVRAVWAPTRVVSDAARADVFTKISAVNAAWADSDVGLMRLGLSMKELASFRAHQQSRRAQAQLEQFTRPQTMNGSQPANETVGAMKALFDALGIAIRAGVDPESAARMLGLEGAEFTGAVPVSLRLPSTDADGLERK